MTSGSLRFEFSDLLDEKKRGETARRWIEAMHIHGVAVVSGVPWGRLLVDRVVLWVWFVKKTSFGWAIFRKWSLLEGMARSFATCELFTIQYISILFNTIQYYSPLFTFLKASWWMSTSPGMPISESPLKDFASALGTYISPSVYGHSAVKAACNTHIST